MCFMIAKILYDGARPPESPFQSLSERVALHLPKIERTVFIR
jgi:hypothetical protein